MQQIVFTRYLYIQQEVCLAFVSSILNKSEDALFWIYELYYSGFKQTVIELIWNIYFDFYALLNPALETYLYKKTKKIKLDVEQTTQQEAMIIGNIIMTLLFRPFNLDVFLLYYIDTPSPNSSILKSNVDIIKEKDVLTLLHKIKLATNKMQIIKECCNIIGLPLTKSQSLLKTIDNLFSLNSKIEIINSKLKEKIILTKIVSLMIENKSVKKGKNIYILVNPEDIVMYETLNADSITKSYKILEKACICGINDFKLLHLFRLNRDQYEIKDIKNIYHNLWLNNCYETPIWKKRILQYNGKWSKENGRIEFEEEDDTLMQAFYDLYGYEPDEQKLAIQNKCIVELNNDNSDQNKKDSWNELIMKHKDKSILKMEYEKIDKKVNYL